MAAPVALRRRLGLGDAVLVGAGSMIGAGVFAAWSPAAEAAGTGLLIGLVIAAVVACCNALSSAQLAAVHPESGGTYVYGRRQLGPAWGHLAGWGFVVGKTASCSAMALTVGAYVWPAHQHVAAVAAVVVVTGVNLGGLQRTVAVTRVLLAVSLLALAVVVVAGWAGGNASPGRILPIQGDPYGILQSAGFLFFAFAGYARIATLGEEVREPRVTIPRAIPLALGAVLCVYAVVAVTALAVVPADALAAGAAPLRLVVEVGSLHRFGVVARVGAAVASAGVLLNLVPGVSRTALAMARRRELPHWFAHVDRRRALPRRAEITVAATVVVLVTVADLRHSLALSGVAVLTYYAVTNAAALTLPAEQRRWPRGLAVAGLVGCVTLAVTLPWRVVVVGCAVLGVGVLVRLVVGSGGPVDDQRYG